MWTNRQREMTVFSFFVFLLLIISFWLCGTVEAGEKETLHGFYRDLDDELYYYDKNGVLLKESFVTIVDRDGEYRYYFDENGIAASGLCEIGEKQWYYFDENHVMIFSGMKVLGDKTWYFGADGRADWVLERFP